jgi:hypothetical protein
MTEWRRPWETHSTAASAWLCDALPSLRRSSRPPQRQVIPSVSLTGLGVDEYRSTTTRSTSYGPSSREQSSHASAPICAWSGATTRGSASALHSIWRSRRSQPTADTPSWEVQGRINGIVKHIFPGVALAPKPLTDLEKSRGFVQDESINAHLDAAIAAAESVYSGNRYQADRVVLHAKEIGALLVNHPRVVGPLERRIKKLIHITDQILVDSPYLERSFHEALDPIRSVK